MAALRSVAFMPELDVPVALTHMTCTPTGEPTVPLRDKELVRDEVLVLDVSKSQELRHVKQLKLASKAIEDLRQMRAEQFSPTTDQLSPPSPVVLDLSSRTAAAEHAQVLRSPNTGCGPGGLVALHCQRA